MDRLSRRCPRLGGPVTFGYCRQCGEEHLPCWKVFDCWWESFDVVDFLKSRLSPDQFHRLSQTRPKPKIGSLLELVEQAKKTAG